MPSRRNRTRFQHPEDDEDGPSGGLRGGRGSGGRGGSSSSHVVDLHGHTLEAAKRRLSGELARCRAAGRSPVRVVTGKGHGSFGGRPVLGPGIEKWLKGPEGRGFGVHSIRKVAGGGALEVTLKR